MSQKVVRKKSKSKVTKTPVQTQAYTDDPLLQDLDDTDDVSVHPRRSHHRPQTEEEKISSVEETIARQTSKAASVTRTISVYLPTVLTIGIATFLLIQVFNWLPNLDAYYDDASSRKGMLIAAAVVLWLIVTVVEIIRTVHRRRKLRY